MLRDQGNYTIRPITPGDGLSISFMRSPLRLTVAIRVDVVAERNQLKVRRWIYSCVYVINASSCGPGALKNRTRTFQMLLYSRGSAAALFIVCAAPPLPPSPFHQVCASLTCTEKMNTRPNMLIDLFGLPCLYSSRHAAELRGG